MGFMASVLKNEELGSFRQTLQSLRSRLRGDLDQMTDEALRRDNPAGRATCPTFRSTWRTWAPTTMTRSSPWA